MKDYFWSDKTGGCNYSDLDGSLEDTFLVYSPNTLFHIGQSYENEPAQTLECKICHSTQFIVGRGSLFTVIKCPNCEWELCIHEG